MSKIRIYCAGSGGMLGEAIYQVFNEKYDLFTSDIIISKESENYLDFRNFDEYKKQVLDFKPNFLFHIGALTDLEFCEKNPEETYITNTLSVENAAIIANEMKIPLIYISTAGIFDGNKDTYDDWDQPRPLCHYARSKFAGEELVKSLCSHYFIFRAGWMMGGGQKKDKKFINKIYAQILNGKEEIFVVDDKFGTPTYTIDFAKNIEVFLNTQYWGVYNMVCEGVTSRYEVCSEMLNLLNLNNKIKLKKVNSDFFKKEYFAPRPKSERLVNTKLNLRSLNVMRDWKICLKEYLDNYFI